MTMALKKREERFIRATQDIHDVVVIGGGVHGAYVARDAALRGYKVLLLEAKDYAFGTSSRSSKLLHGGVRYLEQGNFSLVKEALRERQYSIRCAPHLGRPLQFYFPIIKGFTRPAWQVRIGLGLYDLLAGAFSKESKTLFPTHKAISPLSKEFQHLKNLGLKFSGLLQYSDGQMDDARLVVEAIVDSEQVGAVCLNHARFLGASRSAENTLWTLRWRCERSGKIHESRSKMIINAGGPWAPKIHDLLGTWPEDWPSASYSRGIHLLFQIPWKGPGLILPTGEKGRYYFVLPHFSASGEHTLVGTTDRLTPTNEEGPLASEDEVSELLNYLKRDLPHSGLNRENLYQSFCGMRILAGPPANSQTEKKARASEFSRSEALLEQPGYLLILGGKYTTARLVAEQVVDKVEAYLGKKPVHESQTRNRPFPGGQDWSSENKQKLESEITNALTNGPSPNSATNKEFAKNMLGRFGMQAKRFLNGEFRDSLTLESIQSSEKQSALRCEIRYAILNEHAMSVRDVLWRRLGLGHAPGGGEDIRAVVIDELVKHTGQDRSDLEAENIHIP